jgi:hypothetical protein
MVTSSQHMDAVSEDISRKMLIHMSAYCNSKLFINKEILIPNVN